MENLIKANDSMITLKEVVDLINLDRKANDESSLVHYKAMLKVKKLAKQSSFGLLQEVAILAGTKQGVSKIDSTKQGIPKIGSTKQGTIKTYNLTKKQAIAVGAKLDDKRLMLIVDKLEELSKQQATEIPKTGIAILDALVISTLEQNKKFDKQELQINTLEDEVAYLDKRLTKINTAIDYYTVVGYHSSKGRNIELSEAQSFGRKCTKLSKKLGATMGTTPDPRFGNIKTYHKDVLKEIWNAIYKA